MTQSIPISVHAKADAVEKPHSHYDHPVDVVVDPDLTKAQKRTALDALEQDARQLATASDEGMSGGEATRLHDVLAAKDVLDLPPSEIPAATALQSLQAKLPQVEGTPAHAAVAHAIEAIHAATAALSGAKSG